MTTEYQQAVAYLKKWLPHSAKKDIAEKHNLKYSTVVAISNGRIENWEVMNILLERAEEAMKIASKHKKILR